MESLISRSAETQAAAGDERSDAELVLLSLRDPANFALLYRRYAAGTYRYCDRCLGNREDAEEATQTVFLRALASLGTCRHPEAFRSWLFAIAHNVIITTRMAKRPAVALDSAELVHDAGISPEDHAIAAIEHRDITRLLAQLPQEQRELVELRLQGLSDKEIANVLGRTPGAVRTAQYRAVLRLRELAFEQTGKRGAS